VKGPDQLKGLAGAGTILPFYGVDNLRFKLADQVFEAVEDPSDGYRSYLESISVVMDPGDIFIRGAIALVRVVEVKIDESDEDGYPFRFHGYHLVDHTGHVWLQIGTASTDAYYPSFRFRYEPKPFSDVPKRVLEPFENGGW
jgi:hypothetical protein